MGARCPEVIGLGLARQVPVSGSCLGWFLR